MTRRIIILAAIMGMAAVPAAAQSPGETPFPSAKITGAFVRVQTWTTPDSHYLTNYFPPGASVSFRMFVGDNKTKRSMTTKDVQFARILIPGQPTVQLKYTNGDPNLPWSGTWTIPANYAPGIVAFQAVVRTKAKVTASFVQMPPATSQLTVTAATG
jgi:hypothetical protein